MGGFSYALTNIGGGMVTVEYITTAAIKEWTRRGTIIARAFLIAVGIPIPMRDKKHAPTPRANPSAHDPDIIACFENRGSPMDGKLHG